MISLIAALHDRLEADLTLLRKSFNQRILYFGHLQEISDSVADVEWDGVDEDWVPGSEDSSTDSDDLELSTSESD